MAKENFTKQLAKMTMPHFNDLPNLDLYMDQVIDEVNQYFAPITHTKITKAMINSYVKKGIVDRPVKKRYSRLHLAKILVVSLLKPILSLDTIDQAMKIALKLETPSRAYDQFIDLFNQELTDVDIDNLSAKQYQSMAIRALLYKLVVDDLINNSKKV